MAKILVVDDDIGILELLSEILGESGYVVDTAQNEQDVRKYLVKYKPDLILLDIWMPDIDGITLLKEWLNNGKLTIPVIIMSGHSMLYKAMEATKIGAIDFLEKPISYQKLIKSIERGLKYGISLLKKKYSNLNSDKWSLLSIPLGIKKYYKEKDKILELKEESIPLNIPLRAARDAFERIYFEYHLIQENGSMTKVAEKAGLERTHLYRKLKQLGVDLIKKSEEI